MDAITIDGIALSPAAIAAEAQLHPADSAETAWQEAARALAIRALLLQEARRLGLTAEPETDGEGRRETEEEALVRQLLAREVTVPEADGETCRRYYDNNRRRFRTPELVEARHILFAADPDDEARRAAAEQAARETLAVLQTRPDLFEALAAERSDCPSARQGGNLGQLTRGQTVPEVDTFLFNLEAGQLCPLPVKSRYGFHVLKVERKVAAEPLPFEAVEARIAGYLAEASWRRGVAQYLRLLAGKAEIVGLDLEGSDSPLVQ
ncbi:peptidyl-prolyl cis-trans isomerase C [Tistlia consotensis]|uniref:Parvulin-like PPIase n=1 Tax=Tistlia consotensis USBA 355 TaxID=560819 RepID=A0A1Y6BFZ1_9PROT|nr:peptidylprolyl isomerase [Tistlia consotensis]SMF01955.1 peptidyl-prolyl cis-trans isomerase C [Tistlia consotensis USBA 355]SNS26055.1 peptidyl-prolyl cis-trans isomerase C [Tistlia consotensis]